MNMGGIDFTEKDTLAWMFCTSYSSFRPTPVVNLRYSVVHKSAMLFLVSFSVSCLLSQSDLHFELYYLSNNILQQFI